MNSFYCKLCIRLISLTLLMACRSSVEPPVRGDLALIPLPMSVDTMPGHFVIHADTWLAVDSFPDKSFDGLKVFREVFARKSGYALALANSGKSPADTANGIAVIYAGDQVPPEAYSLQVTPAGIRISAAGQQGVFYALQTLRQMMRLDAMPDIGEGTRSWSVPLADIRDQPAFDYRGLHLDVCRHMMPVAYVKRYIDQLAFFKMNRFHWHLTEDQGWRIEIQKYPRLQSIAAWRRETRVGHYSDYPVVYDSTRYGGFYTQDEIREVVAYAADRGVMVIPEIEMPGHALAALSAYPELGCTGGPYEAATTWGVFEDVFCPKEETFAFLEGVLDEVVELFPAPYIHIGGDECPKTRWKACAHCQGLMQREGLEDEHALQSYFIRRIERYLQGKGRQIIGWDEILEGGLAPNATVMSWRGTQGGIEAARAGHDVIMTPVTHCYFDYYQADPRFEPLAIGGFIPLRRVYGFDPVPAELTQDEARHIRGAQGNLWTEYIPTPEQADYMAYPRAIALAEVLWTPQDRRKWEGFVSRLDAHRDRLEGLGIHFADHLRTPDIIAMRADSGIRVSISTPMPGIPVYYTRDTLGDWDSMQTGDTILLTRPGRFFYKTADSDTRSLDYQQGPANRAVIASSVPPSPYYPGADGLQTLLDGLSGSRFHNGVSWCAWDSTPFVLTLAWDEPVSFDTVGIGWLSAPGSWIHWPADVRVEGSADGASYLPIGGWKPGALHPGQHTSRIAVRSGQYASLRIAVTPLSRIPDGAPGAGRAAWTFIDEIAVF